jgi:hypothetical protein
MAKTEKLNRSLAKDWIAGTMSAKGSSWTTQSEHWRTSPKAVAEMRVGKQN